MQLNPYLLTAGVIVFLIAERTLFGKRVYFSLDESLLEATRETPLEYYSQKAPLNDENPPGATFKNNSVSVHYWRSSGSEGGLAETFDIVRSGTRGGAIVTFVAGQMISFKLNAVEYDPIPANDTEVYEICEEILKILEDLEVPTD